MARPAVAAQVAALALSATLFSGCTNSRDVNSGVFAGAISGLVSTRNGRCITGRPGMLIPTGTACFQRSVGQLGQCVTVDSDDGHMKGTQLPVDGVSVTPGACTSSSATVTQP